MGKHGKAAGFGVITADAERVDELRGRLEDLTAEVEEIVATADDEERDLSEEELAQIDKIQAKASRISKQIAARSSVAAIRDGGKPKGRRTTAVGDDDDADVPARTANGRSRRVERAAVPAVPREDPARLGFKSFGEFATNVHGAVIGDRAANERFEAVASTYGNEAVGGDGGFLVPSEFRDTIWKKVSGDDSLMTRCTEFVTSRNSVTMPKDETTPWQQSGGIQCFWESEGGQITGSKPKFELETQRLDKLTALVTVSEELLEDSVGLESYLRVKTPEKMNSKINTAIVRGNGVGKPLGVLEAASLITVSKETSQNADTILAENISAMWSRMWAPSRRNAVWLINQDIEPQLDTLAFNVGGATAVPLYMPSGGLSASPFGTLKGRPVIPVEPASTLGTTGDIMLVDLSQYAILKKAGEIREDTSMHLYFDQDLMAFRFVFRLTGKPLWNSTITPENGSNTRSWAVTIEDRS